jgi:tetratricopeptide (TPR) repeat protein
MRIRAYLIVLVAAAGLFLNSSSVNAQSGVNSVEGFVFDESHTPVDNAYVELSNDLGVLVARQRSTGSGRFIFRGMAPGRYTITVKPLGTNLREESKSFEIVNTYTRSDSVHLDFRLIVDKRFTSPYREIVGTVYLQEVPVQAKELFKKALGDLDGHRDEKALGELGEAVKIFPQYFDALATLGKKLVLTGSYEKGYPYLLRAIDVNKVCPDCYYVLGLAFYKLNQLAAAIKAVESSIMLQPLAPENRLLLGIVLRMNGDLPRAEKALLSAKPLFKEPSAELYWQLSLLYNRMNRNQEAADALEQYLKASPNADNAEKSSIRELIVKLRSAKQQ